MNGKRSVDCPIYYDTWESYFFREIGKCCQDFQSISINESNYAEKKEQKVKEILAILDKFSNGQKNDYK